MQSPASLPPPPEPLLAALVKHYEDLVGSLRHRFGEECFPREIVNDVCVRLLERPVPGEIANPLAFLRSVARDLAIDRHRAQARRCEAPLPEPESEPAASMRPALPLSPPELALAAHQRQRALLAAIEQLPQASREAFILTKLYGMPQDEAARRMGISRGMVARHLARALRGVEPVLIEGVGHADG
ncbi:RNA polymerase sigma factor [Paracidovorax valerianellae]|uniref:RNA polymerase sigma-70 factor, ECF subfamily n=1 Tax=Paracidovorax valerianellae TaxID=187868 RepID=A0A1G7E0Z7_9BURK|nr:sigma-70 family RNA polymerase sigma factor [Paracidovorax valerianellae]MDA8444562.1 sigma-70 family RNA polymerase sigma factor [Paracidovorax valerianellae]SDE57160.1 RNA polymerase sigma-70 factor, ECF subfamily [Paracidovorax valerianellae]